MEEQTTDFTHERSDLDEVTTQIAVTVPLAEFQKRMESEVKKLRPSVTLKGFRKGKAPTQLIRKLHGERLRHEVRQQLVSETLYKVLEQEKIEETLGEPEFELEEKGDLKGLEEKDLSYKAKVFFAPKPTITSYDSFTVEVESGEVTDEQVDQALEEIRLSQATHTPITERDVAEAGDVISGKIQVAIQTVPEGGEEELEEPSFGEAEPLIMKLGDDRLPAELEAGILGMKVGEEKTIVGTVDEEHRDEELRGKRATYLFTLEELKQQVLPEVTDDFAKLLGMEVETVLELRLHLRERLEAEAAQKEKTEVHAQVLKTLLERNTFAVPQILIDMEIRSLLVRNGMVDPQKIDIWKVPVELFREQLGEIAEERVRTTVIIDRIIEQEGIELSEADIDAEMERVSEEHGIDVDEVKKILLAPDRKESFIREHKQKAALDMLASRTEIQQGKPEKEKKAKKAKKKAE
ncbi:trigger factor [bacterium]|nr:trigger factor [bacterium]